ncbi:hypothetical protein RvY_14623 [Ramazzottius varieornatus]|uniref:Uncharacterized protein n=1 Tax=Ramazzottius varieornatus TaxID=947166 RepID=A0A1D1VZ73_RAMVA|nr:hypothetical protein RvY_14623 [Ramazzottius varieornatus]
MLSPRDDEDGLEGTEIARKLTFDDVGVSTDISLQRRNTTADMMARLEFEMERMDVDDSAFCEESFMEAPSTDRTALDSDWKQAQRQPEVGLTTPSPTKTFHKARDLNNFSTPVRQPSSSSNKRRICSDKVPSCPMKENHYRSRLSMSILNDSGHRSPAAWGKRDSAFFEDTMEIGVP